MSRWASRSDSATNAIWRLLLRLALIAALVYGCYRLRGVITTVFIAAVIAYVLDPMVVWLCHRPGFVNFHFHLASAMARCQAGLRSLVTRRPPEMPYVRLRRHSVRAYATLYVFVLSVIVLWQGAKLIVTPFVAEFKSATSPEGRRWAMSKKEALLQSYNEQAPDWARAEKLQEQVKTFDLPRHLQTVALDAGQRFLEGLKNVVEIVLLPVLAFYFLIDGRKLKHEFVALLPRGRIPEGLRIVNEFNRIMRAFIAGQFILCLLAGVVVGTGLAALGVKYPFILGVLAGVTRAIPIIGPIIGGIPIILLTLVTKGIGVALAVLGFFTLLHLIESKFVMPMLIGDRMELHPVIIILVLLIGGEVGGLLIGGSLGALLGMFFAAPVASLVRVLVRRYWLHVPSRPRPSSHRPPHALPIAHPAEPVEAVTAALPETAQHGASPIAAGD